MSLYKYLNCTFSVFRRQLFSRTLFINKCNLSSNRRNYVKNLRILSSYKNEVALPKFFSTLQESGINNTNIISPFETVNTLSFDDRAQFINNTWKEIIDNNRINEKLLLEYLKSCLDNDVNINFKEISFVNPEFSKEAFSLMLECVCEKGDMNQAIEILGAMKEENISADEAVFNTLIFGQVIANGLSGADSILETMKLAKVPASFDTRWAIIKGLSKRSDRQEFINCLNNSPSLLYDEQKFFEVILMLGLYDNYLWSKELMRFFGKNSVPRMSLYSLDNVCLYLIRRGKAKAAMHFYDSLAEEYTRDNYAEDLLKEMVKNNIAIKDLIEICSNLKTKNLNPQSFFHVTNAALSKGLVNESLELFEHLDYLRPHFFWPLLVIKGKSDKEKGVMEILAKMKDFQVKPDFETFVFYFLEYCDDKDVFDLLDRIRTVYDLVLKDLITPFVAYLLSTKNLDNAVKLCEKYDVELSGNQLITLLVSIWRGPDSNTNCIKILQKICETDLNSSDWLGLFLLKSIKIASKHNIYNKYLELTKEVHNKKLTISPLFHDYITDYLRNKSYGCKIKPEIETELDNLLDTSKIDTNQIKHPRNMKLNELECQLIEQLNKEMEVRGVLRLLIQEYSKNGDYKRLGELRVLIKERNYKESPGMKASFFHTFTLMGMLDEATELCDEFKMELPDFILDSFKILDYATLLVKNNRFDDAIKALKYSNVKKTRNTRSVLRNCLNLLSSTKNPEQVEILFKTIIELQYSDISNVILGPLIKSHLNLGDFKAAAQKFCTITKDYNCTPMHLELLMKLLEVKDEESLQEVLNAIGSVHGGLAARMSFIFALSEKGLQKPLEKFLTEGGINNELLYKRCSRWAIEDKLLPIMTIIKASRRLKLKFNLSQVYLSAFKVYSLRNDCEGALLLWKETESMEIYNNGILKMELLNLLKRCNHEDVKLFN